MSRWLAGARRSRHHGEQRADAETIQGYLQMTLTDRFEDGLIYALRLHADQVRKATGVPYASHLLAVAAIVMEHGGDEDEAIAALLHDAVEDQGGDAVAEEIRERFGDRVADLVLACSDTRTFPKPPWRDRKEAHLEHLESAGPSVCLIAAADKLHNARSTLTALHENGDGVWERFRSGRDGMLWYLATAVDILRRRGVVPALIAELDEAVSALATAADPQK